MERIYNIPLRKEFQKAPSYKRANKAKRAIKEFIIKHMKTKEVKIGKYLNEKIWKNGPKNPPHIVNVKATKDGEVTKVELVDAPIEKLPVKEEKKKTKKTEEIKEEVKEEIKEELTPEIGEKTAEVVAEEVVEQTKEITEDIPKEKNKKVPKASELKEKKSTKKEKIEKVPSAAELKAKKSSK